MQAIHDQWATAHRDQTRVLFNSMRNIFCNDDNITQEYYGLNSIFVSAAEAAPSQIAKEDAFEDFMSLFDTALAMGSQLQKLMLEKTIDACKSAKSQTYGHHLGISQREINEYYSRVFDRR